ncbi:MAG: hypothetical protein QM601_07665 [Pseudoxanthomonas sp.]
MRRFHALPPFLALFALACLLSACGPVKRVSEPAASLQQVAIGTDGSWKVQLRLQNYSSMPMRFDTVSLAVQAAGQAAGTLQASPGISIGPGAADVVDVEFRPSPEARMAAAGALAGGSALQYSLHGSIAVTPEGRKPRSFDIDARNILNPAPGLDGVLR